MRQRPLSTTSRCRQRPARSSHARRLGQPPSLWPTVAPPWTCRSTRARRTCRRLRRVGATAAVAPSSTAPACRCPVLTCRAAPCAHVQARTALSATSNGPGKCARTRACARASQCVCVCKCARAPGMPPAACTRHLPQHMCSCAPRILAGTWCPCAATTRLWTAVPTCVRRARALRMHSQQLALASKAHVQPRALPLPESFALVCMRVHAQVRASAYAGRATTRAVDGANVTGVFVADLTLAELKQLRVVGGARCGCRRARA